MMKRSPDENDNSCKAVKLPLAITKTTPAKEIAIPAARRAVRRSSPVKAARTSIAIGMVPTIRPAFEALVVRVSR